MSNMLLVITLTLTVLVTLAAFIFYRYFKQHRQTNARPLTDQKPRELGPITDFNDREDVLEIFTHESLVGLATETPERSGPDWISTGMALRFAVSGEWFLVYQDPESDQWIEKFTPDTTEMVHALKAKKL